MPEQSPSQSHWEINRAGFYVKRTGDLRLSAGRFGTRFMVLVTRLVDEQRPDEVIYSGSARNAAAAKVLAEDVAERIAGALHAATRAA
jgi:hypothetical protein